MKTYTYYAVRHTSGSFSEITTIGEGADRKAIETIDEAKAALNSFCTRTPNPNNNAQDNKAYAEYWESQRVFMTITKVTTSEEIIDLSPAKTLEEIAIIDIPYAKSYDQNVDRYGDTGNGCIICMKPTNEDFFVKTSEGPDLIKADVTDEDLAAHGLQSQGCFPIGPSCMKKLPKGYAFKMNN